MNAYSNPSTSESAALSADRKWFSDYPHAIIRLRSIHKNEFSKLIRNGTVIPVFRPKWVPPDAPATCVAVIELTRLLDHPQKAKKHDESIRLRVLTVKLRHRKRQEELIDCLIQAVCAELLSLMESDKNINSNQQPDYYELDAA